MNGLHKESGLAEALEQALAEHGSARADLDRDVADLVHLARTLQDTATRVAPSEEFRARSRQRLLARMARSARQQYSPRPCLTDRVRHWAVRVVAGLVALGASGFAAAGASASALPGDPLYPVKQLTESAALQLAPTDSARQELLLQQADTRLDETARLLQQGRDTDAAVTAARYDDTLAALTAPATSEPVQSQLGSDASRLTQLLQSAPPPARPGLERALAATERSLNRRQLTPPAADNETVETAVTPEPHKSQRPSEVADTEPSAVRPSVAAEHGERSDPAMPEGPAASHGEALGRRTQPAPVDRDNQAANRSHIESDAPAAPDESNSAPQADADVGPATESAATRRAHAHPDTAQPRPAAPQRSGAPRPAPPGRGRP